MIEDSSRHLVFRRSWETSARNGAPKLLVVSTDGVADNKAMELRSPVVLDKAGMSVGSKFGAGGTPMAVLIDAEGKIASELAAGAPAVLQFGWAGPGRTKGLPTEITENTEVLILCLVLCGLRDLGGELMDFFRRSDRNH